MKGPTLAGGLGTRLRPLHTVPKQLIPIANKLVLHYAIKGMKEARIEKIGIIVGYTKERIRQIVDSVGDGSKWGIKVTYIEQDAPRGIAHAVSIAEDFIDSLIEKDIIILSENFLSRGYRCIAGGNAVIRA